MRKLSAAARLAGAVVPVLDVLGGCVVQAGGGRSRREYPPLRSRICTSSIPGEAATALVTAAQARQLYVADLDGLLGGSPDWHALRSIACCGAELWIDVGLRDVDDARQMKFELDGEHYRPIVASESLADPRALPHILQQWPAGRAIASIDLYCGQVKTSVTEWRRRSVLELVQILVGVGVHSIILLDLAAVGTAAGCRTTNCCRELRRSNPQLHLISGGGVRAWSDIAELLAAGCAHVLVARALHDGQIPTPFCVWPTSMAVVGPQARRNRR